MRFSGFGSSFGREGGRPARTAPGQAGRDDQAGGSRLRRVRHELRLRELAVLDVQRLSPGFIQVRLGGPDLAGFTSLGFDDHVKLMLPVAGGGVVRRDFTPRRFDPAALTLDIEFALHAHGPASDWARQAAPGQGLGVGGPRGSMLLPEGLPWLLLAGDASALPAIARRLEAADAATPVRAVVLVDDPADVRSLPTGTPAQAVQWVHDRTAFLQALQAWRPPAGDGFAWAAGEAQLMREARELLVQVQGLPGASMRVSAYWKQGTADFHEAV